MRTNKLVREEAVIVLEKNAILGMNFGYVDRTSLATFPLTGGPNLSASLTIYATPLI